MRLPVWKRHRAADFCRRLVLAQALANDLPQDTAVWQRPPAASARVRLVAIGRGWRLKSLPAALWWVLARLLDFG